MKIGIKVLKNGIIKLRGFEQFYLAHKPDFIIANIYIYLIKYGGKNILIDTGLPLQPYLDEMNKKWVSESGEKDSIFIQRKNEEITNLLIIEDIIPDDINYIILTHLHIDHIGGLTLFPNAKIVFSQKGWSYFFSCKYPIMSPREQIPDYVLNYLIFEANKRIYLNNDEEEILPGINISWVGGHSRCSQIIQIKTKKGVVTFCGDVVGMYKNIEQNIPIALIQNLEETLIAMEKIKASSDIFLPGHDPEILSKFPQGKII